MTDDRQLDALARILEEGPDADLPWDQLEALSHGRLDDESLEALRADAEREPQLAAALEAFLPMGREFEQDVTRKVQRALEDARESGHEGKRPQAEASESEPAAKRGWQSWFLPVLAAAAVWVLILAMPGDQTHLPTYSLEIVGGSRDVRSSAASGGEPVLEPGGRLTLVLRPQTAVEERVASRIWTRAGERIDELDVNLEQAATGALRCVISYDDLASLAPGQIELLIALGHPDALPQVIEVEPARDAAWQRLTRTIVLAGSQPQPPVDDAGPTD